ncbi:MAG: SUMF1/EgtB/PvdO family nonheme iron enzyme [Bacteroidota bacterium]
MLLLLFLFVFFLSSCDPGITTSSELNLSNSQLVKNESILYSDLSNKFTTGDQYLFIKDIKLVNQRSLSFSLGWNASWRAGDAFDAAWVFIKQKTKDGVWEHAVLRQGSSKLINNQSSDQALPNRSITPNGIGMIIHREENGQGDNNWNISVEMDKDFDPANTEFRIFGLEMVHIPSGAFELGTLKRERSRREELTPGAGGAPYNPFYTFSEKAPDNYGGVFKVSSEGPLEIGEEEGFLFWKDANIPGTNTFSGKPEGTLSAKFPKGFKGFYQMKYELSQQEYCAFLNTLTAQQQEARDLSKTIEFNRPIADYRNAIVYTDGLFRTSRPHRPCNFISWLDGQAYADWAGLRHMTELEFEKSCRGPEKAIYREYVWGVSEIEQPENMRFCETFMNSTNLATEETGSETIDGNVHASMFSYRNFIDVCTQKGNFYDPKSNGCRSFRGGDGGRGPVRKGIFGVQSSGDRILAGASYYGAMELGGNLQEPVVTVGHPSGRKFEGSHGDGKLTPEGFSDNLDWQPLNDEYAFGGRGGCWQFHENHARISDRFKGLRTNPNRRASHIGFRGVISDWQ